MFRVTIRLIVPNEDEHFLIGFCFGEPIHCLIAPCIPSPEHMLVAAAGWEKSIGLHRRFILQTQLKAKAEVITACTTVKGILENQHLTPAPNFLCPPVGDETTHWIMDNLTEAWLISVTYLSSSAKPE